MKGVRGISPWLWVPTLYFAEGIPYFIVNNISVAMMTSMGVPNGEMALFTSLLYLPWVIKPLWSPFVDILRTKRWWIVAMQAALTVAFVAVALSLPHPSPEAVAGGAVRASAFTVTLIFFWISAFASATHDIAADGFYMLALDTHRQSVFVGIRSTFYRIASVFGQGVLVMTAGLVERRSGDVSLAWVVTMSLTAAIFASVTLWHTFCLPHPETATASGPVPSVPKRTASGIFKDFGRTFATFFRKKGVWTAIFFLLLYRLPEALSLKLLNPFFLAPVEEGGLGRTMEAFGLLYGTVGVIALTVGGILGGLFAGRFGLRLSLWPMALSLALPCGVYLFLALAQPESIWVIGSCIVFDQFGYGFGFTAFMLYMMYFSDGEFKTSHYSLCTAFMALSMMIPGMFAGYIQEALGYVGFFSVVMVCCLATVAVTALVRPDPEYGKKNNE